ncbi:unnamed protein product [Protopolystoma xenopodis]|uniref:Uncharacterized protein n=1 Tax=Protopolystoma xenopodis TaxID=117903 RepID=A0A448X6F2_9PLAT|nr:unnamed protein product [Protopolystoma xenopodis]
MERPRRLDRDLECRFWRLLLLDLDRRLLRRSELRERERLRTRRPVTRDLTEVDESGLILLSPDFDLFGLVTSTDVVDFSRELQLEELEDFEEED